MGMAWGRVSGNKRGGEEDAGLVQELKEELWGKWQAVGLKLLQGTVIQGRQ